MASLFEEMPGYWRIQFCRNGKRGGLRLGDISERDAQRIADKVDSILTASKLGRQLDPETAGWVEGLSGVLLERMQEAGLLPKRESMTLDGLLAKFMSRPDIKGSTLQFYAHTKRNLIEHFGADRDVRTITVGDAKDFKAALVTAGLSKNTVARRCVAAASIFKTAIDHEIIAKSPFYKLGDAVKGNPERQYFVTADVAATVLKHCHTPEWVAIFSLARWGGLRIPSELETLTWDNVLWDRKRIRIIAPKTAHHDDGGIRIIPMFPELLRPLLSLHEKSETGEPRVFPRLPSAKNLRKVMLKIIGWAGLEEPWDKLFQNLRSTRQTELSERFPAHVVAKWMGNSEPVANEHYLQMRDEYFDSAVDSNPSSFPMDSDPRKPVQNPVQRGGAGQREEEPKSRSGREEALCGASERVLLGDEGLEPTTLSV